jgi:hypothetical protein
MSKTTKVENHSRTAKRSFATVPVASLIGKVAGAALRRQGFAQSDIVARWPAVVGDLLAQYSCPERLSFPLGDETGGTLYIRTDGAFALELQHLEPIVLERINSFYGFPCVARLAIRQGPLPRVKTRKVFSPRKLSEDERGELDQALQKTRDDALKQALSTLGEAVLGSTPGPEIKTPDKRPFRSG